MSSNRGKKTNSELEKDFVDCEKYVSKVLKRKIDKPRNTSGNRSKQNDNQDRAVKPFVTGPPSRPQSSAAGLRSGSSLANSKSNNEKFVHKEVIGNGKAAVEITVKAKQKDKIRKRSLSTGSNVPRKQDVHKGEKSGETFKQNQTVNTPTCRPSSQLFQKKQTSVKPQNPQKIPWFELLKDNKNLRSQEDIGRTNLGKYKGQNSPDQVQPSSPRVPNKESPLPKPYIHSENCSRSHHHKLHVDMLESNHVNSRETTLSEESSGFSSSIDEVEYVNKGVQCRLPPSSALHRDSTSSGSSVKMDGNTRKASDSAADAPSSGLDTFSMFNPVRTLNFLIKELHGFVRKTEDRSLRGILMDMEKALLRIPQEQHGGDVPVTLGTYSNSDPDTTRLSDSAGCCLKCPMPVSAEAVAQTLASVPGLALRVDSNLFSTVDNNSGKTSLSVGGAARSDNSTVFQKQLEESCTKLEAMCREMEAQNTELRTERDVLKEEVKHKNQELESWAAKERDYLQAISTLRTNLESSGRMMTELTNLTSQLREENKSLFSMRDKHYKMSQQLQETMRANEQLQKDINLLQLEKEKLDVINQSKDKELERFKKELMDIKAVVMDQLSAMRASILLREPRAFSSFSDVLSSNTTEMESLTSDTVTSLPNPRRLFCSSPSSSKNFSDPIDPSWQISSIPPINSEQSIPELLFLSPVKTKESFRSLEVDSMETTGISDMDEASSNDPTVVQTKKSRELKDELKILFEEMRKKTQLSTATISVPSPPHQLHLIEPEGISQWTDSALNSPMTSVAFSASEAENKCQKTEKTGNNDS